MLRELKEETGLSPFSFKKTGLIIGEDYKCYCYTAYVEEDEITPQEGESEKIFWAFWSEMKDDKLMLPNLKLIVPLSKANVDNWVLDYTNPIENAIVFRCDN